MFWEVKLFDVRFCDKQNQPPLVNYMPTTRQLEIQNSMFLDASRQFFPDFFKGSKHGSSYRG